MGDSCWCLQELLSVFSVIHMSGAGGAGDEDPSLDSLSDLCDETIDGDQEHGDVAVVHEDTGWCMSAHRNGRLVFEDLERGGERHMVPFPKARVLQYWRRLIAGESDQLLAEPWRPGYQE